MPQKIALALMPAAVLLAVMTQGCRDPDGKWTPDGLVFDGSVDDDAGPGILCPEGTPDLFNNVYSPYFGGEEDVQLEVVNISYFRCGHCAHFAELANHIWNEREDFTAHVRFYYHHYPFSTESAWDLHAITVAAGQQGMENFWAVHDYLYGGINDNNEQYSIEEVLAFCDDVLNLDMERLEEDRTDEQTYAFLQWDKGQADARKPVFEGTPTVFVCGEKQSWGNIESVVDGFLYP